ncbi:integrase [Lachnospiraceae bacterium PM6-15]|uniref:tyrosine-type recombinase/integrase n=1 Tax=Ohessyouella blattaphilus TaxID=2949333 RepID=UPI003E1CB546
MATKRVDSKGRVLPPGIYQRVDGTYEARVTYKGRRYSLYEPDLVLIKKRKVLFMADLENGVQGVTSDVTLNHWFDMWLENYKKRKIKPITYRNYQKYWEWYVSKEIGMIPLREIKRIQLVRFYNGLMEKKNPLSYGTVTYINNIVNGCLEQAEFNDLIRKNPANKILKELVRKEGKKKDAITHEQEELFFSYIEGHVFFERYRPMFMVAFGTGMRVGELTALTWEDIDFKKREISVNKTLGFAKFISEEGHRYIITTPKTTNAVRVIPMTTKVYDALKLQKKYQERLSLRQNIVVCGYRNFVFHTQNGKPYYPDLVNIELKRIVKVYNKEETILAEEEGRKPILMERFTPHVIRHTFASHQYELGMDLKILQKIMGHAKYDTTLDIYTHCSKSQVREEMFRCNED